jgi:hypothetical protein
VFNDMCFMAPATLTDRNITWERSDNHHVKARYTNSGITIGAELEFDDEGKLVNFISGDRYELSGGKTFKKYPWLTPVREYGHFNGYYLPAKADVFYRHPEGDFCYLEFELKDIKYNI